MRTQTKPSIRAQLVHLSFVIVVVSIALSLAGTLYFALRSEQTALDNNLLNSASILSQVPMLREALQGEQLQGRGIQVHKTTSFLRLGFAAPILSQIRSISQASQARKSVIQ